MPRTIQFLRPWIYTLLVAHMLIFLHTIIQQLALTPMVFRLVDLVFLIIMLGSQFVVFAMFYTPLAVISWWMKARFFRSFGWKSETQQLAYGAVCLVLIMLMQWLLLEIHLLANTSFYGLSVAVYHLFAMLLVQLLSWLNLRSRLKIQLLRKRARLDFV